MKPVKYLLLTAGMLCFGDVVVAGNVEPAVYTAESVVLDCARNLYSLPGVKFMHRLRAVDSDATITVSDLPQGLIWNQKRKLVEGTIDSEGVYTYNVHVGDVVEPITLTVSRDLKQPTPFMGWLSWNIFGPNMNEEIIRQIADAMVENGLVDAGYNYLCLDDLWQADGRDSITGKPLSNPEKFPGGFKALADYVHSRGLKFGIYSDAAEHTCGGAFGSYGYEEEDARQYADWGFDLLKYDYCEAPSDRDTAQQRYSRMGDALRATGRDILFYMCEWGVRQPWKWGETTGATCWRSTHDVRDCWIGKGGGIGVMQSIAGMKDLWAYNGVNRFNDADMMCVGLRGVDGAAGEARLCATGPGMTQDEYRTQFSLWCMWSSPMTLSFDLRQMRPDDLDIITNAEAIAINQDPMGQAAEMVIERDGIQIYAKDLANGDVAVVIVNLNDDERTVEFDFSEIPALEADATYGFRDVWAHADSPSLKKGYRGNVASHATLLYRLKKQALN